MGSFRITKAGSLSPKVVTHSTRIVCNLNAGLACRIICPPWCHVDSNHRLVHIRNAVVRVVVLLSQLNSGVSESGYGFCTVSRQLLALVRAGSN